MARKIEWIKWDILGLTETRRKVKVCNVFELDHMLYSNGKNYQNHGGVGFLINGRTCIISNSYRFYDDVTEVFKENKTIHALIGDFNSKIGI